MNLYNKTPLFKMKNDNSVSVRLKMEAFQPSGSFKLRGMDRICRQAILDGANHLVSSSGGNAGMSVAYVGQKMGVKVTVVVPKTTVDFVIRKLEEMDAKVIVHGEVWDVAHEYALTLVNDEKTKYIPPFDHPLLWEGHSTIVDELKDQCENQPDLIVLSVGGGGLFCGVMEGLIRNGWEDTSILAVETYGAASLNSSVKAGELVALESINTIATGLGAKQVAAKALEYAQHYKVTPVLVSDEACAKACIRFADDHRILVEPACGASLSVVYERPDIIKDYKNIVVIVCGGSVVNIEKIIQWKEKYL